jgi:hypothetical protein
MVAGRGRQDRHLPPPPNPIFGKRIKVEKRRNMNTKIPKIKKKRYLKILFFYSEYSGVISKSNLKRQKHTFASKFYAPHQPMTPA